MKNLTGPFGKTAYFAGAGGCGMRGLAGFLLAEGWQVWGADQSPWLPDDPLVLAGLQPTSEADVIPPCSFAVRSAAVPLEDSGFVQAMSAGAQPMLYAEMLGEISKRRQVLAVAGSHGKTTCTAWIAWGLRRAGVNVGYLVGAMVPQLEGSSSWGDSNLPLILESCEYARSFHYLYPHSTALINIDAEHPDTYPGGYAEVLEAFQVFLSQVSTDGVIWAGPEVPPLENPRQKPDWVRASALPESWVPGIPGEHNRRNAALVAEVLRSFSLSEAEVKFAVENFHGASRRLEQVGEMRGVPVISDYAHHPIEVAATLQALRERWPDRRLVTVFQPHQAQRFHAYRNQFAPSLDGADALLLLEIYRTRDPKELQASIAELLPELRQRKPHRWLEHVADFEEGRKRLESGLQSSDLVVCLGAGTVDAFARRLCGIFSSSS
ncbi:MAG: Mur ligase domain-containing protein [Planctomycetota bacterium]|nr:Mur ligase domain-containing protein [Planctomycetota bacterium]